MAELISLAAGCARVYLNTASPRSGWRITAQVADFPSDGGAQSFTLEHPITVPGRHGGAS